jgi:hypothetical protein
LSFALDFGLRGSFLLVSVEPASPRLYLIERRARDLQKASIPLGHFGQLLRAKTNGAAVVSVDKDRGTVWCALRFVVKKRMERLRFAGLWFS